MRPRQRGNGPGVIVDDVELVRAFSDPAGGRHSLQVEVNRRLYMDERTRAKTAGFAVSAARTCCVK